jgi:hypothetical protein
MLLMLLIMLASAVFVVQTLDAVQDSLKVRPALTVNKFTMHFLNSG